MKTPKTSLMHGISAAQGRVMGNRAVGGLAAVTTVSETVLRVAEIDLTGASIELISSGVVRVGISSVGAHYRNNDATDFKYGDVVVLDTTADSAIRYTTTPQDTRPVGVVQADIPVGETGPVAFYGDVPFVRVTAAVTRGNFAETSASPGLAQESPTRRMGSFAQFLSGGTEPAARLLGSSDTTGTGADDVENPVDHGNMGSTETLDMVAGTWHRGTLNADCAITVAGFTVDKGLVAIAKIEQNGIGGWAITWDPDLVFIGRDQPAQAATATTYYVLWSDEGDATIYAARIGPAAIEDLTTDETDTALVLAPDGAGGVEFRAETGGGSGDPADDPAIWMPLTTVVAGAPELVWDGDDSLIPTLVPV